ncbi:hypothetical protein TRFO_02178 [Tritrichomonas foetus]|uniref:RETREG1-3/ARL6IP-like N-terminal reticulon-homology domain-containing protein n=1 Tax=Tritrichomonas foetus TaxID=1144522 RepID=A0A1J4J966_9EUKA|nr:hypothetical protein TRFO_02178 [Tritrichomonas foetus]|eukprot:OHS95217.1 hypothetical protein TRFO_02178 [Tritrichomonas foetus]
MHIFIHFCHFFYVTINFLRFENKMSESEPPMGSCPILRYKPNDFVKVIEPYSEWFFRLEGMLFWRRPIPMAILLVIVELTFIFVRASDLGLFSVLSMIIAFRYIIELLYKRFGDLITQFLFQPIDEGKEGETNRIYPILPFCQRGSYLCSVIYIKIQDFKKALKENSAKAKMIALGASIGAFFFFWVCGTFWPVCIFVNLVLLAPGIVMHPQVFPHVEPFILKFASSIGCPYCQAH